MDGRLEHSVVCTMMLLVVSRVLHTLVVAFRLLSVPYALQAVCPQSSLAACFQEEAVMVNSTIGKACPWRVLPALELLYCPSLVGTPS